MGLVDDPAERRQRLWDDLVADLNSHGDFAPENDGAEEVIARHRSLIEAAPPEIAEALEAEWYSGNIDEHVYARLLAALHVPLTPEHEDSSHRVRYALVIDETAKCDRRNCDSAGTVALIDMGDKCEPNTPEGFHLSHLCDADAIEALRDISPMYDPDANGIAGAESERAKFRALVKGKLG